MINKIIIAHDKIFNNTHHYLYLMSIYHLIIIAFTLSGIQGFDAGVFYELTLNPYQTNIFNTINMMNIIESYIYIILILIIDVIFFIIIMMEFNPSWLKIKNIFLIEILILGTSFTSPVFRDIMFFLSLNTLQITIVYKLIKYIPPLKYVFIAGSYILIFKLLLFPLLEILRIY